MKESKLCTDIVSILAKLGYFAYKIPDPSSDFNITVKRPFDIISYNKVNNIALAIEAKVSTTKTLSIDRIAPHQYGSLLSWNNGYIVVYNKVTKMYSYLRADRIKDKDAFRDIKGYKRLKDMIDEMVKEST